MVRWMYYVFPVILAGLVSCQQLQEQRLYGPDSEVRPDEGYAERRQEAEARLQRLQKALREVVSATGEVTAYGSYPNRVVKKFRLGTDELTTLKKCLSHAKTAPMKVADRVHPSPPQTWEDITLWDAGGRALFAFTPFKSENNAGFISEEFLSSLECIACFIRPNLSLPGDEITTMQNLPTVQKMWQYAREHSAEVVNRKTASRKRKR